MALRAAATQRPDDPFPRYALAQELRSLGDAREAWTVLAALLDELGKREWTHLIVEGGVTVLQAFLTEDLIDELQVYIAQRVVGEANLPRLHLDEVLVPSCRRLYGDTTHVHPGRHVRAVSPSHMIFSAQATSPGGGSRGLLM